MTIDWPFIGIKEGWIENGWTPEQMMQRSLQIKIPPQTCYLQPYYMNFLQRPNSNEIIVKQLEKMRNSDDISAWIAGNNLWTPGQTINITFTDKSPIDMQNYVKAVVLKYLQPHVSMKLNFMTGNNSSVDIIVNIAYMKKSGGNSTIGKSEKRPQSINLNSDRFKNIDIAKLDNVINTFASGKFIEPRYIVCHEFGHAMGLYHEWTREMCNKKDSKNVITCSDTQDMNSVMNYWKESTTGLTGVVISKECMDSYSPGDIAWLKNVYGTQKANFAMLYSDNIVMNQTNNVYKIFLIIIFVFLGLFLTILIYRYIKLNIK